MLELEKEINTNKRLLRISILIASSGLMFIIGQVILHVSG